MKTDLNGDNIITWTALHQPALPSARRRAAPEQGSNTPVHERFDIVALLDEVVRDARVLSDDTPVVISGISCLFPMFLNSVPLVIRSIMMSLLQNAIRNTNRGRIALILSMDGDTIHVTVTDTGRGMTAEQIRSVQKSTDQQQNCDLVEVASSDLDLRTIRSLLKWLNGGFSIVSKLNEGTIVSVSLPRETVPPPAERKAASAEKTSSPIFHENVIHL